MSNLKFLHRSVLAVVIQITSLCGLCCVTQGQTWDSTYFGPMKVAGTVSSIAADSAQMFVVGNFVYVCDSIIAPRVVRYVFADQSWHSLNNDQITGFVCSSVIAGNCMIIGGAFDTVGGVPMGNIARWCSSGWSSMSGGAQGPILALATDGNYVYAGGKFDSIGNVAAKNIAKWNGSAWSALGAGVDSAVTCLFVRDSTLYVGGSFEHAGDSTARNIAKWTSTGWSRLAGGVSGDILTIASLDSGIIVGGRLTEADSIPVSNIARWTGTRWDSVGYGTNGTVYSVAVADGIVLIAGAFTSVNDVPANRIAGWTASNGLVDLGSGVGGTVRTLVHHDSSIYVGGDFLTANGHISRFLTRLLPGQEDIYSKTKLPEDNHDAPSLNRLAIDRNLATVQFSLPRSSRIRVQVVNSEGKVIRSLFDGPLPRGEHLVKWSVRGLQPGVYYYQVESSGHIQSKMFEL